MRSFLVSILLLTLISALGSAPKTVDATRYVTVSAGAFNRRDTVVSFALPSELKAKSCELIDSSNRTIPLQVDDAGQAWFLLAELAAGAELRFRLREAKGSGSDTQVRLDRSETQLAFSAKGRPLLTYQAKPGALPRDDIKEIFRRGGYIHPVYTPSGRLVTDDYPPDHPHHHGIWFAWTKTEFQGRHPDFWNMGDGTGKVEFMSVDSSWTGPVHGGFTARHRYVDLSAPTPTSVLNEQWKVMVYGIRDGFVMFDLICTQECATSSTLDLPEYRYGGIGFRGHHDWLPKDNCVFLTSEGKDRSNGHGTRGRWCHVGGRVGGQFAGLAMLDHPDNFRAPQAMRINPDQPFLCYSPSLLGEWKISPGTPYVSKYRFVVYDGEPRVDDLNRLWSDYANPPRVTVSAR